MSYDTLLRDAEYFCSQAEECPKSSTHASVRYSTASILFSFMAVEFFINNMMSDFASLPKGLFTVHEKGFLAERSVVFSSSGVFEVTNRPEYKRLEDKILFLVARFSGNAVGKGSGLWQKGSGLRQRFQETKDIRDRLTHPRKDVTVEPSPSDARKTLEVVKEIIKLVSSKVWGKSVQL